MIVNKIGGCAGSGKTTEMIKQIAILRSKYEPSEFIVTAYRRPVADKLLTRLNWNWKEAPYVNTIHGICLRLMDTPKTFLEQEGRKDEVGIIDFCKTMNLPYAIEKNRNAYTPGLHEDAGNVLLDGYNFLVNNLLSPEGIYKYSGIDKIKKVTRDPVLGMTHFINAYEEWKEESQVFDYTDMLKSAYESEDCPEDTKVLAVDECQDLTPIQQEIIKGWMEPMDHVILAADTRQGIYDYMGSTSDLFEETNGTETPLYLNRRCGKHIWDFSTSILTRAGIPFPAVNTLHDDDKVQRIDEKEYFKILSKFRKNTFHLVRLNQYGEKTSLDLMRLGIPFIGIMGWETKEIEIYNAIWKLRNRKYMDPRDAEVLTEVFKGVFTTEIEIPKKPMGSNTFDKFSRVEYVLLAPGLFVDKTKIDDIYTDKVFEFSDLKETPFSRRTKILNALSHFNEEIIEDKMVIVSTIHYAKGLEADTVFVHDRIRKIDFRELALRYPKKIKAEAQTFHVATSRARNHLFIVNSASKYRYSFPQVVS